MAHLEHPPFSTLSQAWSKKDTLPQKIQFEGTTANGKHLKVRVTPDDGLRGPKFLLGVTITEFHELQAEFGYKNQEKWAAFWKCLQGEVKTIWDEIVDEGYQDHNARTTDEFKKA